MLTTIFSILTPFFAGGSVAGWSGPVVAAYIAAYFMGLFAKSNLYRSFRGALGRTAFHVGVLVDKFGSSKFGVLWNPVEQFFCDTIALATAQFTAGLRENDVKAMVMEADRLKGVGSENRLDVVLGKLHTALEQGATLPVNDPVTANVVQAMHDSIESKLKD